MRRRINKGQELLIPGDGVQPFLLETRAPHMYCTGDLGGRIRILDVTDETLKAWLEVSKMTGPPPGNTAVR